MSGLSIRLQSVAVTDNGLCLDLVKAVNKRYIIYISLLSGVLKGNSNNFRCCFQCWQLVHLQIRYGEGLQGKDKGLCMLCSSFRKMQVVLRGMSAQTNKLSGVNWKTSYTRTAVWKVRGFQILKCKCKEIWLAENKLHVDICFNVRVYMFVFSA